MPLGEFLLSALLLPLLPLLLSPPVCPSSSHTPPRHPSSRKKYGYAESERRTLEFSAAAVQNECLGLPQVASHENGTLAMVPFYGGRPPNVTKDLKVKSIGQGNSLVSDGGSESVSQCVLCVGVSE